MELKAGTPVHVKHSNFGYVGDGIIVSIAYGNSYLVRIEGQKRSIILVQRQHLIPTGPSVEVEDLSDEKSKKSSRQRKKEREVEEFLADAMEGRFDDENPKDGRRGHGSRGRGKRLPSRRRG